MSVINQMLKDLQRRQGATGVAGTLPAARLAAASRAMAWWWGWLAAAALAAGLVYVSWGPGASPPHAAPFVQGGEPPAPAEERPAAQVSALAPISTEVTEIVADAPQPEPERVRAPSPGQSASGAADAAVAAAAAATTPQVSERAPSAPPMQEVAVGPPELERTRGDEGRAAAAESMPPTSPPMERRVRPLSDAERGELAYRRALAELDAGQETPARAALREALVLAPAHRDAAELLAALLVRSATHEEAQQVLEAALRHRPGDPMLTQLLAHAHVRAGRVEAAVAVLERDAPPSDAQPDYHALLAALYQQLGRHEPAAQSYRALLQVDAEHAAWWVGLAISLEGRGHWGEALSAYRRAQELGTLAPDLARYAENRVTVLERTRR